MQPRPAHCRWQTKAGHCGRGLAQEVCQRGGGGGGAGCTRHAAVALFESGAVASAPPASRSRNHTRQGWVAADSARRAVQAGWGTARCERGTGGQAFHGTAGRRAACWGKLRCAGGGLPGGLASRVCQEPPALATSASKSIRTGRGCGREQPEVALPPR